MIFDASRRRAPSPWTRARLVVPGMRGASTWRLAGQATPARRFAVRRAAFWAPAATAVCGVAVGAVVGFFLDPTAGRRRRRTARDRALSRARRSERAAAVRVRRAESRALGAVRRAVKARRGAMEPLDDVTLKHKVESELYRRAGVPKGHISVNAEDGVVFLRGVMDRHEQIERMEAVTRRIRGVGAVENLVHTPGTPAPPSRPKLARERPGA
jgi:BON domain-containing protein